MFPKKHRVPKELIKKVVSEGQKCYSELFLLKKLENCLEYDRFAVIVSKKVSKSAVLRHLFKRRFLESIKSVSKTKLEVGKKYDFVLMVSKNAVKSSYSDILLETNNKKEFILN